jgi:hypothetical protein
VSLGHHIAVRLFCRTKCGQVPRQFVLLPACYLNAARCARSAHVQLCAFRSYHSNYRHPTDLARWSSVCDGLSASVCLSGDHSDVSSAAGTFGVISALAMPAQIQCFFAQVRPDAPAHICIGPDPTGGRCHISTSHMPVAEKQEANCADTSICAGCAAHPAVHAHLVEPVPRRAPPEGRLRLRWHARTSHACKHTSQLQPSGPVHALSVLR